MNRITFIRQCNMYGEDTAMACALNAGVCLALVQLWLKSTGA